MQVVIPKHKTTPEMVEKFLHKIEERMAKNKTGIPSGKINFEPRL